MKHAASPKTSWTAAQTSAIETFGSDVCVAAGAGSGKTAVLVERYLHAVQVLGFKPSEILAITFTDKAAAEMKHRLIQQSQKRALTSLRADLESAPIGTIHAFCARILRENPAECGVDPEFRILGDAERELVVMRVFDKLIESEAADPEVIETLALYGEEEVRKAFARLHERSRAAGPVQGRSEPDFAAMEKEIRRNLLQALSAIQSARRDSGEWTAVELRTRDAALLAKSILEAPGGWKRLEELAAEIKKFHSGSKALKESVRAAKSLREEWEAAEAARLALPMRRVLLRLYERYEKDLEEEKKRRAAYDFDDLIDKVLTTLRAPDAVSRAFAERQRGRFRAVFVDEYQDVNPAQAALVELLRSPGSRFVVGDQRQSIYGFRHADPEIFVRARSESTGIELADNFRSRPAILEFVNAFFAGPFAEDKPLAARMPYGPKKGPCVDLVAVECEKGEKGLDRARVNEAKALAKRLRQLVDSQLKVEPKNEAPRPVEWRDIAVLFRKGTAIRFYDKAFRDAGIPFDLPKGKGFFEKNEIVDLLSFLSILDDPKEDIPLAAVLRSPLAGLSDDALFWMAQPRAKEVSLFQSISAPSSVARLSEQDRSRLQGFLERYGRLRSARERLGISRILETLLEETGYRLWMASAAGPQSLANIDKLIDLARECESAGGGVADFVRLTRVLADRDEDEPEAKMPADPGNAVSFLTVHAAKGLEFPVVALADLGAEPKKQGAFFRVSSAGDLGFRFRAPDGWKWIADPIYRGLQEEAQRREAHESERLLYVAMTRAREHLILSGVWKAGSVGEGEGAGGEEGADKAWMKSIFETCGFEKPHSPGPEMWKSVAIEWVDTNASVQPPVRPAVVVSAAVRPPARPLPVKLYEMTEDVTVTRLVEAASREQIEALLAEEPDKDAPGRLEEDGEPLVPANRFGTVFHQIMERTMHPSILGPLPPDQFEKWAGEFSEAEKRDLRRQMEGFWKSETGSRVRMALRRYPELPFIYKTRHGLLKGQMDLVYQAADGKWGILDYKTNRVTAENLGDTAKRYEFQLALYAFIFSELTGRRPSYGVLYFSSPDQAVEFPYSEGFEEGVRERLEEVHGELIFQPGSAKL